MRFVEEIKSDVFHLFLVDHPKVHLIICIIITKDPRPLTGRHRTSRPKKTREKQPTGPTDTCISEQTSLKLSGSSSINALFHSTPLAGAGQEVVKPSPICRAAFQAGSFKVRGGDGGKRSASTISWPDSERAISYFEPLILTCEFFYWI